MPRRRDHELLKAVGARIRELREARDLTQAQLAEAVEISVEMLGRVEAGRAALSLANLVATARAMEVRLPALLDVEGALPEPVRAPSEARLLASFRVLNDRDREVVLAVVEVLRRGE